MQNVIARFAERVEAISSRLRLPRRSLRSLLAMTLATLGCGGFGLIATPTPTPTLEPTWTVSPLPSPSETITVTPTFTPTETLTPSPTSTSTSTLTPTSTPTPEFAFQGPGQVVVPILLYHHVGYSQKYSLYYVSPLVFESQMNYLYTQGYRTISVELLVEAIQRGAQLPNKPILLTFDDGSETMYTDAFPIMQRYGFTGTAYIVHNFIGAGLFMDRDQIRELNSAGWEIGSHGVSHVELPSRPGKQEEEIVKSRQRLEAYLDVPVRSFAYPFGAYDSDSLGFVKFAGYIAAMGLGDDSLQSKENIYYLYRHSITAETTLETFSNLLLWKP